MTFRLSAATIDCTEPRRVAQFWADLPGGSLSVPLPGWLRLTLSDGPAVELNFEPVTEPKSAKARLRLDLGVDAVDSALERDTAAQDRAIGAGLAVARRRLVGVAA